MNWLVGGTGVLFIAAAMMEALWTTLSTRGSGPLSSFLAQGLWRLAHRAHPWNSSYLPNTLQLAGPTILLSSLLLWVALLWVGWTLLYSAEPDAIRTLQTETPAELAGRIYFTGYTLFTLGIGNYVPKPGAWEIATAIASLNGLFLITLSITYLVSILSAATKKHQLAAVIAGLGHSPRNIVHKAWTNEGFASFQTHLAQLVPMIEMHARNHLAYPMLHYFHSPKPRTASSLRLAALDEALLIMSHALDAEARPEEEALTTAREAIGGLLSTLRKGFIQPSSAPPRPFSLDPLIDRGLPIRDDDYRRAVDASEWRRRLLKGYVEDDGWTWTDINRRSSDL